MPKIIYNEGRVVGLSAYETYVKNHIAEDPNTPPASEREWLASSLAAGVSILLKFPKVTQGDNDHSFVDIPLPADSKLCAANTIMANFFKGNASTLENDPNFAKNITDYGELLSNTSALNPSNANTTDEINSTTVPISSNLDINWSKSDINKLNNYMKVIDGVVIQPGQWVESTSKPPEKTLIMNQSERPVLRFHVFGNIDDTFWMLLTGFSLRSVVVGESGLDTSTDTDCPEDGDYLGPATFPWASKIVFSVPSSAIAYFSRNKYKRKTAKDSNSLVVDDTPIIDMRTTNPATYYKTYNPSCAENLEVESISTYGKGGAVLTVYQRHNLFPPALFGTYIDKNDIVDTKLYPVDTVAPGTVKIFKTFNDAKNYESSNTDNYGLYRDSDYILNENVNGTEKPVAKSTIVTEIKKVGKVNYATYKTQAETGNLGVTESISLKKDAKTSLDTSGKLGSLYGDTINWNMLLAALGNNRSIDPIGPAIRTLRELLQKPGNGKYVINKSNGDITLAPATDIPEFFMYHFPTSLLGKSNAVYSSIFFDVIGWTPTNPTDPYIATIGTAHFQERSPIRNIGNGVNWFQKFNINSNKWSEFYSKVASKGPSNGNCMKITIIPVPSYSSNTGEPYGVTVSQPDGKTIQIPSMNMWTGYINQNGAGVVICRNGGRTAQVSSINLLCTFQTFNSDEEKINNSKWSAGGGTWT
jgi:hypothetical protein